MNVPSKIGFPVAFVFILLFVGTANADDYVDSKVPSDEIIMKNIISQCSTPGSPNKPKIERFLGKYQDKDGIYHVIYLMPGGMSSDKTKSAAMIKLDTNLWLINPPGCWSGVIQK